MNARMIPAKNRKVFRLTSAVLAALSIFMASETRADVPFQEIHGFKGSAVYPTMCLKASDKQIYAVTTGEFPAIVKYTNSTAQVAAWLSVVPNQVTPQQFLQGADGTFYVATANGPVLRVTGDGNVSTFANYRADVSSSSYADCTAFIQASDGNFFGVRRLSNWGSWSEFFEITADGTLTNVAWFYNANKVGLIEGNDGNLYGTTDNYGANGAGNFFRMTKEGAITELASFESSSTGHRPNARPVEGPDGSFYGTTAAGGANNSGTVFRASPDGTLSAVATFDSTPSGTRIPNYPLTFGSDGYFYGMIDSPNGGYWHQEFTRIGLDGTVAILADSSAGISSPLVQGDNGNFYACANGGGDFGYGALYQITVSGSFGSLASFQITPNRPTQIAFNNNGSYYGVTDNGGNGNSGTLFEVQTNGTMATVCAASAGVKNLFQGKDGYTYMTLGSAIYRYAPGRGLNQLMSLPTGITSLFQGNDMQLYGGATGSGYNGDWRFYYGYLFQAKPASASYTNFHFFNYQQGAYPACLIPGSDGNFYGLTTYGGVYYWRGAWYWGSGVLFKNGGSKALKAFSSLYDFCGDAVLTNAISPDLLVQRADGFYGASKTGGSNNLGVIFKVTAKGQFTFLKSFDGTNGATPTSLILGTDGFLYGTTQGDSVHNCGTVFKMFTNGAMTTLVTFTGDNGSQPGSLVQNLADGSLYGVTYYGGSENGGTVFKVPNVFPAIAPSVAGAYNGLFYETAGVKHQSSGFMTFTVTTNRALSGRVLVDGGNYAVTGTVNTGNAAHLVVARPDKGSSLTIDMQITRVNGAMKVTGTVGNGSWTAQLTCDGASFSSTNLTLNAGTYTMVLPGGSGTISPGGDSYGFVTVSTNGAISLKGALSDNAAISQATGISKDGYWPLYVPLYAGKGSLLGWVHFENGAISGDVSWIKGAVPKTLYPAGFTNSFSVTGGLYTVPSSGTPLLSLSYPSATLSDGDLVTPLVNSVTWSSANKITVPGANTSKLVLTVTPASALVAGSVINPTTKASATIRGVVCQWDHSVRGFFVSKTKTGGFVLRD